MARETQVVTRLRRSVLLAAGGASSIAAVMAAFAFAFVASATASEALSRSGDARVIYAQAAGASVPSDFAFSGEGGDSEEAIGRGLASEAVGDDLDVDIDYGFGNAMGYDDD